MTARPHQLIALAAALLLAGRSGNAVHAQSSATLDVALSSDQARVGDVVEALANLGEAELDASNLAVEVVHDRIDEQQAHGDDNRPAATVPEER